VRFVDAAEVGRVLTFPILIAALEGTKMGVEDGFLGRESEQYFVRHAVDRSRGLGASNMTGAIRGDPDGSGSN
jgi:hypothetical protein